MKYLSGESTDMYKGENMKQEEIILCGSNAYTRKYYLNEEFTGLPETIKDELRVYSLSFVDDLFNRNSWDMNQTYHMSGIYSKKLNAVIFYYKDAVSAVC